MSSAINATSATSATTPNTSRRRQQFPLDYNDFTATPSGSGIQDDLVKLYSAVPTQGGVGQSAVSSRTKKNKVAQSVVTNNPPQAETPSAVVPVNTQQEEKMQEDPEEDGDDSTPGSFTSATTVIPVATAVPSATPAASFMSAVRHPINSARNWYNGPPSSAGDLSIATALVSKQKAKVDDEEKIDFK
jgi:hypothetical protein